ncbi:MAG: peptidylprolyl isomerase [Bacteroidetes bacterium]|nr:peptidylprolyl isomerase [Bacteroidota bacterium]
MRSVRTSLWFLIVSVSLTSSALQAQAQDSVVREAWYWQDQRVGGWGRLVELTRSPAAEARQAAFRAVAHRSDSGSASVILEGVRDENPGVRGMAAFAAGQRLTSQHAMSLLRLAMKEGDASARRSMFDAFGRIAARNDVDSLAALAKDERGARRQDVLIAMMRSAVKGLKEPQIIWYASKSLQDGDAEVRWRALYVLGRSSPHALIPTELASHRDVFERLVADRSADVRLNLATMLARVDVPEARDVLTKLAGREFRRRDRDWRVLVQVVRSAGTQLRSDPTMGRILVRGLTDENDHVAVASAMALPADAPSMRGMDVRDSIRTALWSLIPAGEARAPLVTGEAMVALARFSPSDIEDLQSFVERNLLKPRLRAKALEAFSTAPTASGWKATSSAWQDATPSVAMAAWDHSRRFLRAPGIGAIVPEIMSRQELSRFVTDEAEAALGRRDMGISTVVATLLGDSSVIALIDSGGHRERAVETLSEALATMRIPDDVEAMQATIQALGAFGGVAASSAVERMLLSSDRSVVDAAVAALRASGRTDIVAPVPTDGPDHTDYDWNTIRSLGGSAVFVTDRGEVTVDLLPEEAPFTVLSFVRLARKRFFDGLTFHRVVPNFVVQGGDPRGDGWGGPGYSLRTEVTARAYERGSVGMASAGRDTEGSQFFFTHLPTPHLDGRYTIFARVRQGIETVDRWQVGDVIREVRIIPAAQRGARSR